MMTRFAALLPVMLALSACATPTTDPTRLPSGQWALDPGHASAVWSVKHLGLSWYTGRFDAMSASLDFDPQRPEDARLTAIIDAASLSTGDPDFDEDLRGGAWFDAGAHPQIIFVSERIETTGPESGRAHGLLTLKGRTEPAVLEIDFYGGVFNLLEGRDALGFGADLVVDRSAFGIGGLPESVVGHEVRIRIEAEFLREGDAP